METRRLKSFRNKTVLITGASSGIGRAIAERGAAGARLALVARGRHMGALDAVASRVRALGGDAHTFVCDVADRAAALACVADVEARLGGIDVAVINAGIGRHRTLVEHDLDDAERLIRTNVLGSLYFAHALAPRMLGRGAGWLVFMASVAGLMPLPGEAVYAASKFAIVGLAESLAIELAPKVHVLTVCPGMVKNTRFLLDDEHDRISEAARRTAIEADDVARATFEGLARGLTRVVVPASLRVAVALRGVAPELVRMGTARQLAPILERARAAGGSPARGSEAVDRHVAGENGVGAAHIATGHS